MKLTARPDDELLAAGAGALGDLGRVIAATAGGNHAWRQHLAGSLRSRPG